MTDAVAIALIGSVTSITLNVLVFIRQGRQGEHIEAIKKATNGMQSALMEKTAVIAHAEGMVDEKARADNESNHEK